ncbi:MAG: glycosyltransferase family 39 protein [Candidatus Woesearchaeota archaeon]
MKLTYWILIVLILVGGVYRLYDLGHDSYWIDESYTVLAAKNIGTYGYPQFDSGVSYISALPQAYSLFIMGSVFGYSEIPMRILSAVAGMALIFAVFLLARRFDDDKTALIASGLITFSYFMIAWSRQARMYIFVTLFAVLAVYYYMKFFEKHNLQDFSLMMLFLLLGYFTHAPILIVIAGMIIHYVILKRAYLIKSTFEYYKRDKKTFFIFAVLIFGIAAFFIVRHLLHLEFVRDYSLSYRNFLLNSQYLILFFSVIGLFGVKKDLFKNSLYFIIIVIAYLLASFFVPYLNYRYLFIVLPFLFILASSGIVYIINMYKNNFFRIGMIAVILLLFILSGFFFLPKSSYALELGTPQPPFRDAYDYLESMITDETLIVTQPAVAELYYGKADYWLAISYENRDATMQYLYNSTTGIERYSGIQTIDDVDKFLLMNNYVIVIDDMGMQRLSNNMRDVVLGCELLETFGDTYWNRVYVYAHK